MGRVGRDEAFEGVLNDAELVGSFDVLGAFVDGVQQLGPGFHCFENVHCKGNWVGLWVSCNQCFGEHRGGSLSMVTAVWLQADCLVVLPLGAMVVGVAPVLSCAFAEDAEARWFKVTSRAV